MARCTLIIITGSNFAVGVAVYIGSKAASLEYFSSISLQARPWKAHRSYPSWLWSSGCRPYRYHEILGAPIIKSLE